MSFDAFGARRNLSAVTTSPWVTLPIAQQRGFDTSHTTHGYTGHEGADKVGLIHMNGRMYDPVLGRFIQADSIVQDPFDPQSLNRYAYVLNNPLSATDPSGNISFKNALKLGVAIGITVYTGGIGGQLFLAGQFASGIAVVAFGGAAAGVVTAGPKGAVRGAFTALVFFGAGQASSAIGGAAFGPQTGLGRALVHGIAGGTLESLTGGNFGHGFATAGLGKAISSRLPETGSDYSQGALAALVGGTLSEASGGNFANGALTGAMQFAFNQLFGGEAAKAEEKRVIERIQAALIADGSDAKVVAQVRIRTTLATGKIVDAIADYAYQVDGKIVFGEVKTGFFSRFTINQKVVYAAINSGQVEIVALDSAERLGLKAGVPLASGSARLVVHALDKSRAASQFGRLFAGQGENVFKPLGRVVGTLGRIVGGTTFSAVTLFFGTNDVSALGALSMECAACSAKAVSPVD